DFTPEDLSFIRDSGRDPAEIARQAAMLRGGWRSLQLGRPARIGDGIEQVDEEGRARLRDLHRRAAAAGRISAFVPASGSGTRMFQSLIELRRGETPTLERLRE